MPHLDRLAWPALERRPGAVLLVPVGATEQHGPHLPLTVDTDIAVCLARLAAERRPDALVAPPVAFGSSGEHQAFPGTLSIGRRATELLLIELVRSATESVPRVLLVSTHGGNADAVNRAVRVVRSEGRDARAWTPGWTGDAHAGRTETSVMLSIAPERVDVSAATGGATAPIEELLPQLERQGVRRVSANGVLGDPAGASADEGSRLLAEATGRLLVLLERWIGRPVP